MSLVLVVRHDNVFTKLCRRVKVDSEVGEVFLYVDGRVLNHVEVERNHILETIEGHGYQEGLALLVEISHILLDLV